MTHFILLQNFDVYYNNVNSYFLTSLYVAGLQFFVHFRRTLGVLLKLRCHNPSMSSQMCLYIFVMSENLRKNGLIKFEKIELLPMVHLQHTDSYHKLSISIEINLYHELITSILLNINNILQSLSCFAEIY